MKSFDPMNDSNDSEIEKQLLEMELRLPPAGFKSMILQPRPIPWFPKAFVIGVTVCWAASLVFILITPIVKVSGAPALRPAFDAPPPPKDLLGFNAIQ